MGGDHPLGHFFAAETVCFLGFAGFLRQPESPLGRAALRVLHSTFEGLRCGVQPQVVVEARLGELIEDLWDCRPAEAHPLIVRVFAEALRLHRRAQHADLVLSEERYEQEAYSWQMSRLAALEEALQDYLDEAAAPLAAQLLGADFEEQGDILRALDDIHGEAAEPVLALLARPVHEHAELAVNVLAWSKDERVGPWLRVWIHRSVPLNRRMRSRPLSSPPPAPSLSPEFPYAAVLRALRNHASRETESLLLQAARDWDPIFRAAAFSSLGWWEPLARVEVERCLKQGRRDPNQEVRQFARAALARLGERDALQGFRLALSAQESQRVHEAIHLIAQEGIYLLWPDLDRLAETENIDVALHARESLERLREGLADRSI